MTHDFLRYINILTYLLTYLLNVGDWILRLADDVRRADAARPVLHDVRDGSAQEREMRFR